MKNIVVTLIMVFLAFPYLGSSQDRSTDELSFEVNRSYPPISITKEKLKGAHTLLDLNEHYKSSWIRTYISVEILTSHKGKTRKAVSKNDMLTQEQKDNMYTADVDADISVNVQYLPENTLKNNDAKEINFTFSVNPESEASYTGGQQQLKKYLKEKAIEQIPGGSFVDYDLAAVKFTVDEEGRIIDPLVLLPKDEKIDKLLLEAICNMPNWKPATHANGTKVKQEFVLTVGNMENCMVNLLNIRKD
ncbi:MAG: energy transducer TonB [Saprospiraceae bacterium]